MILHKGDKIRIGPKYDYKVGSASLATCIRENKIFEVVDVYSDSTINIHHFNLGWIINPDYYAIEVINTYSLPEELFVI